MEFTVTSSNELATFISALMQSRQTILPKRLLSPGPDAVQMELILGAAASAPDHGQLLPWRFVLIPPASRHRLAAAFSAALLLRDPNASSEQLAQAQEKAYRAPMLLLVVVDAQRGDLAVPLQERIMSAGCAVQNMLLMATAIGLGSALTSAKAFSSAPFLLLFSLAPSEIALCFISIGTPSAGKPSRLRPASADYVSYLPPE